MGKLRLETDLIMALLPRVTLRQELIAKRDEILHEIAALSDQISTDMVLADQKSVRVGPHLLTLVENPGRNTLDKKRLAGTGRGPRGDYGSHGTRGAEYQPAYSDCRGGVSG